MAKPAFPRSASAWWYGCGGNKGTSAMKNGDSEESVPSFYASDEDVGKSPNCCNGRRKAGSRWWKILETWIG